MLAKEGPDKSNKAGHSMEKQSKVSWSDCGMWGRPIGLFLSICSDTKVFLGLHSFQLSILFCFVFKMVSLCSSYWPQIPESSSCLSAEVRDSASTPGVSAFQTLVEQRAEVQGAVSVGGPSLDPLILPRTEDGGIV